MPLVRISLLRGRSDAEVRTIADAVHDALVDAYGVPVDDRFQIIEQRDPNEIIYSANYLDIARTDAIIIIHVIAGHWRDTAQKQALYRSVTDRLAGGLAIRREDVQVVITSNDKADWSFGGGVASYVPQEGA